MQPTKLLTHLYLPIRALKLMSGCIVCTAALSGMLFAQQPIQIPTSVDSALLLDAAGPEQRRSLSAIYLMICPNEGAGTAFLLDSGVLVTNRHVVATCNEQSLIAKTDANQTVEFSKIILDEGRDLALLIPKSKLQYGLKLAAKDNPPPGTEVSTWGYPLLYNGASPLLSVGYVSGFRQDNAHGTLVKHIIVNGAFNHGNSGGHLMVARSNEVIGVVVLTFHFYPPQVKMIIDTLAKQNWGMMMGTGPDGSQISEAQLTAAILDEFYQKTQVMIGEAISGSEVRAMLHEHEAELRLAGIHTQVADKTLP
jgi:S1-C subfamily serine protease